MGNTSNLAAISDGTAYFPLDASYAYTWKNGYPQSCSCVESDVTTSSCKLFQCTCKCDITAGLCDYGCCCDPDCTSNQVSRFKYLGACVDEGYTADTAQLCYDSTNLAKINPRDSLGGSSTAQTAVGDALCVYKKNYVFEEKYYTDVGVQPNSVFSTTAGEKNYNYIESSFASTSPDKYYDQNDTIQAFYSSSSASISSSTYFQTWPGYFTIPQPDATGICTEKIVLFERNMPSTSCHKYFGTVYSASGNPKDSSLAIFASQCESRYSVAHYASNLWLSRNSSIIFTGGSPTVQNTVNVRVVQVVYEDFVTGKRYNITTSWTANGCSTSALGLSDYESMGGSCAFSSFSAPSILPTPAPSAPSFKPTLAPTSPTPAPTPAPTRPTVMPSVAPTSPTRVPTAVPSAKPTLAPSSRPTSTPSSSPTLKPTMIPTSAPTPEPTMRPTSPSPQPTFSPSAAPSLTPSVAPTNPTVTPTAMPTLFPSRTPTAVPSSIPTTSSPTFTPSAAPSTPPTVRRRLRELLATNDPANLVICQGMVKSVDYVVYHFADAYGGIKTIEATVVITDVPLSTSGAFSALQVAQSFSVLFVSADPSGRSSTSGNLVLRPRSGNPGYLLGSPLIIGVKSSTSAPNGLHTVNEVMGGFTVPSPLLMGLSDISSASASSSCPVKASVMQMTRLPVSFGYDISSGCLINLNRAQLQQACQVGGGSPHFDNNGLPYFFSSETVKSGLGYFGLYGNADPLDMSQWLSVPFYSSVPPSTWLAQAGVCSGVVTGLQYKFLVARSGEQMNPQNKIISASASVSTSDWALGVPATDNTTAQAFQLSVTVTFVFKDQPDLVGYVPPPPPVLFKVPYDVFYPFYSAASPVNSFNWAFISVITVITALTMVLR